MSQGHYWRGIETMSPKWLRDPMKATRYIMEDAKTFSGIDLKEMSPQETMSTMIGLSSSDLGEIYDQTNTIRNLETRRRERKRELKDRIIAEVMSGAKKLTPSLEAEVERWSRANPGNVIDKDYIKQAFKSRQNMELQMENGIRRTRANADLIDRFDYAE